MKGADETAAGPLPFRENPQNRTAFQDLKGFHDRLAVDAAAVDREGMDVTQEPAHDGISEQFFLGHEVDEMMPHGRS